MNRIFHIFIVALLIPSFCFAADHYASPSGSASWANSTSVGTPCSLATAFANAAAGDTVYLRGGTYTITSTIDTVNTGTAENRIVMTNYPDETPTFSSSGLTWAIGVEDEYWTFDGLTMTAAGVVTDGGAGTGAIKVGNNGSGDNTIIKNCTITLTSTVGHDNVAPIVLQGDRCDNTLIENNTLTGYDTQDHWSQGGVHCLGGGSVGVKVNNNRISTGQSGIRIKHVNADTSLGSGAEMIGNYITDVTYGSFSNPVYFTVKHNIVVADTACFEFGSNGGGGQGHHNLIDHNTCLDSGIVLQNPSEGPVANCTITNNILMGGMKPSLWSTGSTDPHYTTLDYNLYVTGSSAFTEFSVDYSLSTWITHYGGDANSIAGSPTFVGGASPTTIAGFALTAESNGYQASADGSDWGADVDLVGIDAGGESSTPQHSGVNFSGASFGN